MRSSTGVVDPQSRQATVVITLPDGTNSLVPGQLVQARIFASAPTDSRSVNVAQESVQTLNGREVVFVRTPQGFRAQPVKVMRRSQGRVEIAEGIGADVPIATDNAFLLKAELGKENTQ